MSKIKVYKDLDISKNSIINKTIGIIGYGNQGRAQCLNLKDSKLNIIIGLRTSSKSRKIAKQDGFNNILDIDALVIKSDIICILIPDEKIPEVFSKHIENKLTKGQTLIFAHGYCVYYKKIKIPKFANVALVAPSGSGKMVRDTFLEGSGVPNLIAIEQDYTKSTLDIALSYSKAIGGTRIGAYLSTFEEETVSDIFGEQTILTGGLPHLMKASFDVLVNSGYSPEVAWLVCYYEVKSIIDSFHSKGFEFLNQSISNLAEYGGVTRGEFLIDKELKNKMKKIIKDIQDGTFEKEWSTEKKNAFSLLKRKRQEIQSSNIEKTTKKMLKTLFDE